MRHRFHWPAGIVLTALAIGSSPSAQSAGQAPGAGQTAPPATAGQPSPRSVDVTAILVDVVVRDKNGNPVADLKPDEIQLTEDGVRQQIGSFTPIFRDGPAATGPALAAKRVASGAATIAPASIAPSTPGAAAAAAAANTPVEVLALLFDRLGSEPRTNAYRAALSYLGNEPPQGRVVAVYGIDLGLVPYQAFTTDMARVRKAIEEFGNRAVSQFGSTSQDRRDLMARANASSAAANAQEQAVAGGGPGAAQAGQGMGSAQSNQMFAEMQARSLQTFDALERDQRGYSTANALMAVVSSMRHQPGRKAVVFFSEGLSIPPNAQERFLAVVAAANRANVSIYSVDATGLRTESTLKETRDEVDAASARVLQRNPTRELTGEPMMAALERNENNLRLDPHSGLGLLADQTGGLLVSNTNDFRRGLARVDSDLRNYYMVSYVPSNDQFDGRYREISVRVTRPGVSVQHRKGYFAVKAPAGAPVLAYEAPALAILDRTPVPNAFPVRLGVLSFPETSRPGLTPIVVELPTAALTFKPADAAHRADASVVVRIKNDAGDVFDKMSQRYELQAESGQLDRAKAGEILFYRETELPPGVYTIEAIVRDALADKASVRFSTLVQRAPDDSRLRASSLVVVRRGERIPEAERDAKNPLYVGDTLVSPNIGTPLKAGADKELGFYFVLYPRAGAGDTTAVLNLVKNGQVLAGVPLQLDKPDEQGRIRQLGRIPIDQLEPGSYELRVVAQQATTRVTQAAAFRITNP